MLILSLTSIPPRFVTLRRTLDSLLHQGADEIRLTLPQRYRRFPDWDGTPPVVPAGVQLVRCAEDVGPATKWAPSAEALRGTGARLLICDDDWIYAPGWADTFRTAAQADPGATLTGSAFPVARLGLPGAPPGARVAQGFSGILLDPDALPRDAGPMPDCAFGADDVWLSGLLARAGSRVVEIPAARALCRPHAGEAGALQSAIIAGRDRAKANLETAAYLGTHFGVWRTGGADQGSDSSPRNRT